MRTTFATLALVSAAVALGACAKDGSKPGAPASGDKTAAAGTPPSAPAGAPLTVEDSARVSATARVDAVDYAKRQLTLRDASGRVTTLTVSPEVQRLNEVKPGDNVKADYNVSLLAELRAPTAQEAATPVSAVEVAGRAPKDAAPAAGVVRGVKVVTTVQAVDLARMLVTLKGPMGDTTTVRARNPENVKKLRVGDTIVITYVESAVVSLVKTGR